TGTALQRSGLAIHSSDSRELERSVVVAMDSADMGHAYNDDEAATFVPCSSPPTWTPVELGAWKLDLSLEPLRMRPVND
ncbi:hypothetical protein EsDP_00007478, partial [Epichloe bromicola]